jgi:hypothetical protein
MTMAFDRRKLVVLGAGAGIAAAAPSFARAAAVPDGDLAYLRLLVATELLKGDFEARASKTSANLTIARMQKDDAAHYASLAILLTRAGQTPATADDIDFAYPKHSFDSAKTMVALARTLTELTLGAYLGAIESVQTPSLRLPLGQIAANEARQLSALSLLDGHDVVGHAFAPSLQIEAVSAALTEYES